MRSRRTPGTSPAGVLVRSGLLAVLAVLAGCAEDSETNPPTGVGGSGAGSAPYERVLTDELTVGDTGERVVADCWNGICVWQAAEGTLELLPDRGSVAVAPDAATVVTVDDGTLVLEDLATGEVVREFEGLADADVADGSPVTAVAFSPDGSLLAGVGPGAEVRVWSVDDGDEVSAFTAGHQARAAAFSPDGTRLALAGGGPVEVWDVESGRSAGAPAESGTAAAVAWSPAGDRLVGPGADGAPTVWDAGSFEVVAEVPQSRLHEVAVGPGGSQIAFTALDETAVMVWSPDDGGDDLTRLRGHDDEPGAVAWGPAGEMLYSVAAEDGVRRWDLDTGEATELELPEGR